MKYFFTIFFLIALSHSPINAQDTIVLKSGQKILARHIHIHNKLYFRDFGSYPNKRDTIDKAKVNYVVHHSGWKIPMEPPPWFVPITIGPGIGLSTIPVNFHDYLKDTGANLVSFSPVYSLNIDVAPSQNFSIGVGVAWQSLQINPYVRNPYYADIKVYYLDAFGNLQWYITPNGPAGGPDYAVTETLTRLNVGGRFLYHIRNDNEKDFYLGMRVGLSMWTDNSNPGGYNKSQGNLTAPSIQAIIGERKEINNFMGFFMEGGIGTPYFADAGLYFKFNTKQPTSSN